MRNILLIFVLALLTACNEKIDLRPELYPEAGGEQLDVENDGYVVNLQAEAPDTGQEGRWYATTGNNGVFADSSVYNTQFSGEPGQTYVLQWMLADDVEERSSYTTVSFKEMDTELYMLLSDSIDNMYLDLFGNQPKYGASVIWEITDGDDGIIENADSHEASLWGTPNETYKITYSHLYGDAKESVEFDVTLGEFQAHAGDDKYYFDATELGNQKMTSLWATLPYGATGSWEIVDGNGGDVKTLDDPTSLFVGTPEETYILKWTVDYKGMTDVDTVEFIMKDVWGRYVDTRDNNEYRTVIHNDLEWFVDNFRYNYTNDDGDQEGNFYYGTPANTSILDGEAVDTPEEREYYGKLYPLIYASYLAPDGWRLPTEEEWTELCNDFGGVNYAGTALREGGDSGMELVYGGYHVPSELSEWPASVGQTVYGTYWCYADPENLGNYESYIEVYPTSFVEDDEGNLEEFDNSIVNITPVRPNYALSVRYVRDVYSAE